MKLCPMCKEEIKRRVKGKCPHCGIEVMLIKGRYIQAEFIPPVKELARVLEKQIKQKQDSIFPYKIPQHMILRTNKILENVWLLTFPTINSRGISNTEAINLFELAVKELLGRLSNDNLELGLILWYVSGKDTNKFQRILTKYIRALEKVKAMSAEEDNWMDD